MSGAAEVDLDDIWACASLKALQRITDLARKVLKGSAAAVWSLSTNGRDLRCLSDPQSMLDPEAGGGGADAAASIEVPIRLSSDREIGAVRVFDISPRDWSDEDRGLLDELAACLTGQIELKLESIQRQKAEADFERVRTHLLAVADRIPGLVFERRKVDAARSRYTFFGVGKSQLPAVRTMMEDGGTGDLGFVHRDDREVVRAAILRSNLEETDLDLTFRVKDFERRIRWLRSQSIVRRDGDGTVFWDGLIFDISDLVAAREEAEAARAAKDKALLEVDDALRAPLEAIVGLADALRIERQPETAAAHASNIKLAAESLLTLVDRVVGQADMGRPAAEAGADAHASPGAAGAGRLTGDAAQTTPDGRAAGRILLADDLDLNRKLIADMLSLEGHVVESVADGAAAVEMASRQRFDLILMDMIMPIMDGLAATQAIRALPAPACHVPIVALTAHSMQEQLDSCLSAGMDATLTKPMSIDALNGTVEAWIGGRNKAA